jgi:pimeloyl-ACP methyl ester carboxylesterase
MRIGCLSIEARTLLLPFVLLALPASLAKAQETPPLTLAPLRAELPDGRHLALYCVGTGSPTVIFDAGLGGDAQVWSRVQPEIAKTTRACAFDRPGYGASDEGPAPRDAAHIVSDLKAGLDAAGIAGPYVLVGHSMAGYDMRLFANLYTKDVVGMVLVDPSIDGNEAPLRAVSPTFAQGVNDFQATVGKCIRATAEGQMAPGNPIYAECGSPLLGSRMANAALARTALSEQQSMDQSSRQVLASEPASSTLPLIVLTSDVQNGREDGMPESERMALTAVVRGNHAAIAARSSAGIHRVVEGAPHNIQWAQPDAVVAPILEVIGKVDTADR